MTIRNGGVGGEYPQNTPCNRTQVIASAAWENVTVGTIERTLMPLRHFSNGSIPRWGEGGYLGDFVAYNRVYGSV